MSTITIICDTNKSKLAFLRPYTGDDYDNVLAGINGYEEEEYLFNVGLTDIDMPEPFYYYSNRVVIPISNDLPSRVYHASNLEKL